MKCRASVFVCCLLLFATSAFPAAWYLDNAATGGANNGTSWANAWTNSTTIGWASINAGDTLFISGGTTTKVYTNRAFDGVDTYYMLRCTRSGSAGNPITITVGTNSGHNGRAVFNYRNHGVRTDQVVLSSYNILDGGPNTNLWFINNTNQMNKDHNPGVTGGGSSHVTVTRVGISNVNNGLTFNGGADIEISSNQVIYIIGDVAVSTHQTTEAWDQIRIHHNYIQCISDYSFLSGADGVKPGRGATVHHNELRNDVGYGFTRSGQHADAAIQTAGFINFSKYYANRIHAFYNSCFEFGVEKNTHDILVWNNVTSYDNPAIAGASHNIMEWSSEGWLIESIKNVYFLNNTFVDHSGGNVWMGIGWDKNRGPNGEDLYFPTVTNLVIQNNLFYNISRSDTPVLRLGDYPNPKWDPRNPDHLVVSHNLIHPGSQGGTVIQVGTNYHGGYAFSQSNPAQGEPKFVSYLLNSPANNFRLLTNSPGVGVGANLTALLANFGLRPEDIDGNPRPPAHPWTIGAYEVAQAGGTASISVNPLSQDFGTVAVGATADRTLTVSNSGTITLFGNASVPAPFSIVSGGSYNLAAGQSQTVTVRYSPSAASLSSQNVTFSEGAGASALVSGLAVAALSVSAITHSGADVDQVAPGFQIYAGSVIQLSASASAPNGDPLAWQWCYTVNGGSETIYQTGSGVVTSVSFNYSAGTVSNTYVWILRASNSLATAESVLSVNVIPPPPVAGGLTLQADAGTISSPYVLASGYIYQAGQTLDPAVSGRAAYTFTTTQAGKYVIQCSVNAPGDANNSLFLNIDAEPESPTMIWDIPITLDFEPRMVGWRGTGTFDANQFVPKVFTLSAGTHQLIVRGRESNVQVAGFSILRLPEPPVKLRFGSLN